jgi:hypothetical protein
MKPGTITEQEASDMVSSHGLSPKELIEFLSDKSCFQNTKGERSYLMSDVRKFIKQQK